MASASTSDTRLFLRTLWWASQEQNSSLLDGLKAAASAAVSDSSFRGKVLTYSSGNGREVRFEVPPDWSPRDLRDVLSDLLDRYDEALAKLPTATDAQLYAEILSTLQERDGWVSDYRAVRDGCRAEVQP